MHPAAVKALALLLIALQAVTGTLRGQSLCLPTGTGPCDHAAIAHIQCDDAAHACCHDHEHDDDGQGRKGDPTVFLTLTDLARHTPGDCCIHVQPPDLEQLSAAGHATRVVDAPAVVACLPSLTTRTILPDRPRAVTSGADAGGGDSARALRCVRLLI